MSGLLVAAVLHRFSMRVWHLSYASHSKCRAPFSPISASPISQAIEVVSWRVSGHDLNSNTTLLRAKTLSHQCRRTQLLTGLYLCSHLPPPTCRDAPPLCFLTASRPVHATVWILGTSWKCGVHLQSLDNPADSIDHFGLPGAPQLSLPSPIGPILHTAGSLLCRPKWLCDRHRVADLVCDRAKWSFVGDGQRISLSRLSE